MKKTAGYTTTPRSQLTLAQKDRPQRSPGRTTRVRPRSPLAPAALPQAHISIRGTASAPLSSSSSSRSRSSSGSIPAEARLKSRQQRKATAPATHAAETSQRAAHAQKFRAPAAPALTAPGKHSAGPEALSRRLASRTRFLSEPAELSRLRSPHAPLYNLLSGFSEEGGG